MGVTARKGLIAALRSRISDDRATVDAFSLSVTANAKSASLEINNGIFSVSIAGGEAVDSVRFPLTLPQYNTVGKLIAELSNAKGYTVVPANGYVANHPSIDLQTAEGGIVEVANNKSHTMRHRNFADEELLSYLAEAVTIHNPNYTINNVPDAEHPYVLLKASARAFRVIASDSVKRRGLDTDADIYVGLARDLEDQYREDIKRIRRVIPSPRMNESRIGTGDFISGKLYRRSLRAGYTASYRTAVQQDPPNLYQPADDDVEDTLVRMRWQQDRGEDFSYWELWRDTHPNVERHIAGRLERQIGDLSVPSPQLPTSTQYSRAGTSTQVFGLAVGANRISPVFDGFFFWTAAELAGSNLVNVSFTDGVIKPFSGAGGAPIVGQTSRLGQPLEPEFDYYYRLYSVNWNGEVLPSNVVHVRTRIVRAKFDRDVNGNLETTTAMSPTTGPLAGGTSITINGTNIVDGTKVYIGGKQATETSRTATQIVVDSPGFTNAEFKNSALDIVMESPTGLKDIIVRGWVYT